MTVRGQRSIYPSKGRTPSGLFSTKGSQKSDPTSKFPHQDVKAHAHSSNTRSKPAGTNPGLRHQKPNANKIRDNK